MERKDSSTPVILVVDDELVVRKLVDRLLTEEGYRVLSAADGYEALGIARSFPRKIDLLLTDIQMPRMDGIKLAEQFRTEWSGVRVLLMSGMMWQSQIITSEDTEFISKPFFPEELLDRVRTILK